MEKKTEFKKYNKAIALKIIRILEKRYMKGYFFENSQDAVKDAYQLLFDSWNKNTIEHVEEFKLLLMNRSNAVLGILSVSKGGISGTITDVRLIFQAAIKSNASAIIVCHNHPSGNRLPSEADKRITYPGNY